MNTFLFDLDGSLLPLNEEEFVAIYFSGLCKAVSTYDFSHDDFLKALWHGISAMRNNNGETTNEKVFWSAFSSALKYEDYKTLVALFMDYYRGDFDKTKKAIMPSPYAALSIKALKEKGYRLVLATNPLFPQIATYKRIKWAGLNPADFALITTFEHSYYCKPCLSYYQNILRKLNVKAEDCIMVGNDVEEDLVAARLGLDVYLLTECLINSKKEDYSKIKNGKLKDLYQYILTLPTI